MLVLLFSTTLAAEPLSLPPRPEPAPTIEGECAVAADVEPGTAVTCRGVLLPRSLAADYLSVEDWATSLEQSARLNAAVANLQIAGCESNLAEARQPRPVFQRPEVILAVGALVGGASIIGGAYAIGLVSQ